MRARRAVAGLVLLVLAGLLGAEALGPYLSVAEATSSLTLPIMLTAIAILTAGAGIVLVNSARFSEAEESSAVPTTVEDPQHPSPIRSPVLPFTAGGNSHVGVVGGKVVTYDDEDRRDED